MLKCTFCYSINQEGYQFIINSSVDLQKKIDKSTYYNLRATFKKIVAETLNIPVECIKGISLSHYNEIAKEKIHCDDVFIQPKVD